MKLVHILLPTIAVALASCATNPGAPSADAIPEAPQTGEARPTAAPGTPATTAPREALRTANEAAGVIRTVQTFASVF